MSRRSDASEPYSYVHSGTLVEGSLVVEGRLRIDGRVLGEVRVDGVLEIAPGGRIEGGPVRAASVRIAGEVVANVDAEGTVELWRGGRLEGDVRAGSLDVEEGARFLGRSLMRDEDRSASERSEAAPDDGPAASASEPSLPSSTSSPEAERVVPLGSDEARP